MRGLDDATHGRRLSIDTSVGHRHFTYSAGRDDLGIARAGMREISHGPRRKDASYIDSSGGHASGKKGYTHAVKQQHARLTSTLMCRE